MSCCPEQFCLYICGGLNFYFFFEPVSFLFFTVLYLHVKQRKIIKLFYAIQLKYTAVLF